MRICYNEKFDQNLPKSLSQIMTLNEMV